MTNHKLQTDADIDTEEAKAKILLVDDREDISRLIELRLGHNYQIRRCFSAEEALGLMATWAPDLIITDLLMPGMSGMDFFERVRTGNPMLPVIMLTAHGTIPDAVKATQLGVSAFLTKPFSSKELVSHVDRLIDGNGGIDSRHGKTNSTHIKNPSSMLSRSPAMELVWEQIESLAESDNLIALSGAPGTGKDDLAEALYGLSRLKDKPLHKLSCTSLPYDLLEREIFGCVGNGTVDNPDHKGLLQRAHQSTILISDYCDAPRRVVEKMLQALIAKQSYAVDSMDPYPADIRGITTTYMPGPERLYGRSLMRLAERLNLAEIKVPSLDERREDIPMIAKWQLDNFSEKPNMRFSRKAMQCLMSAEFPGNVRQLVNTVQQCARMSKTQIISDALVQSRVGESKPDFPPLTQAHTDFERNYLIEALTMTNGNVSQAAKIARRNRTEFHRLLRKHSLEAKSFKQ